jgi:maleylpyruvate isomerase
MTQPEAGPGHDLGTLLRLVSEGTEIFEAAAARAMLGQPSSLPGWTRAHVVAHVARNADALVNLLTWARARTGEEAPMYTSAGQRAADIKAGTRRPEREIAADLRAAGARFAAAASGAAMRWDAAVRTARGQTVPAAEVPWMRAREVWVHAVDLDAGLTFDALPAAMTTALLDDVTAAFATRQDVPPVELRSADSGRHWTLGLAGAGAPAAVTGTMAALAAYATGRPVSAPLDAAHAGGRLPALPAWL